MKKLVLLALVGVMLLGASVFAQEATPEPFTEEQIAASPYLQSVLTRQETMYDTSAYAKEGPYRIALAAQGTSNSWSALFDEHARWYAEELGPDVIGELLYADAQASADIQVPQVEDLLAQEPDALILVPMGAAALSAPVERAMAQGVPVILCASTVDTDNFVTEVGTNLYASGAYLAQYLVDQLGGEGSVVLMAGIPGVTTSDVMQQGAEAVFAANPGITVLDVQPGNWSTAEAKTIMETWIAQYGDEIDGVWSGGAQMSQGIVSAYLDAGAAIPPIGGGEFGNGFLRLALENDISYAAWQYPNAMVTLCMDTALAILRGEPVPRFIDFQDSIPNTQNFTDAEGETYFNPNWSDDVFGPILFPEERLEALGFVVAGS
ncbi:MAG: substrate-binding domain-containing protein [Chloroflexi bacterium]|jgi:ribose transport system substrate-binding protein|uniref:substrate-binding domain-containing protein n=1 Tax=Candidatus Flexifilum breve TaxID=3140694 RepID=UPI0031369ECE|nr:substrate-binding domain-containing protein [Chloroflexota bacterium]MBK9747220.1 substrate-binding domain-containing protein [Chloroflexota bacterium]